MTDQLKLTLKPTVRTLQAIAVILLSVWIVFGQCRNFDFVGWDDDINIFDNPNFKKPITLDTFKDYWADSYRFFYMPVTYSIWSAEVALSDERPLNKITNSTLSPRVFHVGNIIFHMLSCIVVFQIIATLLRRLKVVEVELPALIGTLIFAIHPVQVESVAWISGLRDLGFGLFALLSTLVSLHYFDHPTRTRYAGAFVLFLLALLAKPTAAALVPTGLFLGVWLFERPLIRSGLEYIPHTIATILLAYKTHAAQAEFLKQIPSPETLRPLMVLDSFGFYFGKLMWPFDLTFAYGRIAEHLIYHTSTLVVAAAPVILFCFLRRVPNPHRKPLLLAYGLYLIWLLPTSGLIKYVSQIQSTVFDRYLYIPIVGVGFAVAWVVAQYRHRIVFVATGVVLALLAIRSWDQAKVWRDCYELYSHSIEVEPDADLGYWNLAIVAAREGHFRSAKKLLSKALEIDPEALKRHDDITKRRMLGDVERLLDRYEGERDAAVADATKALGEAEAALARNPDDVDAQLKKGNTMIARDRLDEARDYYTEMVRRHPDSLTAHNNLGAVYLLKDQPHPAREQFQWVLNRNPNHPGTKAMLDRIDDQSMELAASRIARIEHDLTLSSGQYVTQIRNWTFVLYTESK